MIAYANAKITQFHMMKYTSLKLSLDIKKELLFLLIIQTQKLFFLTSNILCLIIFRMMFRLTQFYVNYSIDFSLIHNVIKLSDESHVTSAPLQYSLVLNQN